MHHVYIFIDHTHIHDLIKWKMSLIPKYSSRFGKVDSDNENAVKTGSSLLYDCLHQKSVPLVASLFASAH